MDLLNNPQFPDALDRVVYHKQALQRIKHLLVLGFGCGRGFRTALEIISVDRASHGHRHAPDGFIKYAL
jgi:hypothetical protein